MITFDLRRTSPFRTRFPAIFRESLEVLAGLEADSPLGRKSLGTEGWYVDVHEYVTRPEPETRWESHNTTIDIQACLDGAEEIAWMHMRDLGPIVERHDERDFNHHAGCAAGDLRITLKPGTAVLFYPDDGHRPMIAIGEQRLIRKVVVKIPVHLIETGSP